MIESNYTEKDESYFAKLKTQVFDASHSYLEVLKAQENFVLKAAQGPQILWGEHSPTVTLGKRCDELETLTAFPADWTQAKIERGGQVTLHSPGQLVCYPILDLRRINLSIRDYIAVLENSITKTLLWFSIQSLKKEGITGVFTEVGKIAFIGIRVKRGVTMHGISINVKNNLEPFQWISACGITKGKFDKVENYRPRISVAEVASIWQRYFLEEIRSSNQHRESLILNS